MKIQNTLLSLACAGILSSCLNNGFMDKYPLDQQTPAIVFSGNENFKTYMWQFYVNRSFMVYDYANVNEICDGYSDNACTQGSINSTNPYSWDKVVVPTSGGGWDFGTIRGLNLMLDHIDQSQLTEEQKYHWRSVGYFFKALDYFYLLNRFGDVPWLEHYITDLDTEELYKPATPRNELASKIMELLQYAKANIGKQNDGPNTINKDCINALISRFGLFEGTWQKYHQLSTPEEYTKYIQASLEASSELITKYPTLIPSYDAVFNSKDLAGKPGIILYKNYLNASGYGHAFLRNTRAYALMVHPTADLVQSYLCTDGKPIRKSELYLGNHTTGNATMSDEFMHRDRRLLYTIVPPYRLYNEKGKPLKGNAMYPNFMRGSIESEYKFLDIMSQICEEDGSEKQLPILQWGGKLVGMSPHFNEDRYNMGQIYCNSRGGYYLWKYYNTSTDIAGGQGDTDAPIFRMGEILVNHAEAAFELEKFDQAVADITINKLRQRAHVANMVVADISEDFDPERDTDVAPLMWEIRRERRVELMAEGFRFNDIRRWKKGSYLNKIPKGVFVTKEELEDGYVVDIADKQKFALSIDGADSGRVIIFGAVNNPSLGTPSPGWLDKYYLYPLPIEDLILNKNLKQNPGYPQSN
ncbi:MAG: RagB/SusD family nutrient uptake outer membrane protein [Tannerellaceae bacterium]